MSAKPRNQEEPIEEDACSCCSEPSTTPEARPDNAVAGGKSIDDTGSVTLKLAQTIEDSDGCCNSGRCSDNTPAPIATGCDTRCASDLPAAEMTATSAAASKSITSTDDNKSCVDECCDAKEVPVVSQIKAECTNACCDKASNSLSKSDHSADGCCDEVGDSPDDDSCCNNVNYSAERSDDCCKEDKDCCCDTSCLDRLALRDCEGSCGTPPSGSNRTDAAQAKYESGNRVPCDSHKQSIRDRYLARLMIIGCLCRDLISRNQESCCSTKSRKSGLKALRNRSSPVARSKKQEMASCGVSTSAKRVDSCSKTITKRTTSNRAGKTNAALDEQSSIDQYSNQRLTDVESGLPDFEHAVLSVSGMTCTGCETKLNRTLSSIDSIWNVKTSLVLSRVEFDLNPRVKTLSDMIQYIERTTEFKCEKLTSQGLSIDVLPRDVEIKQFVQSIAPLGVSSIESIDEKTVRVHFDAKLVGARELLERGFEYQCDLAPPRPDASLAASHKHLYTVGFMTLLSALLTIPVLVMAWAPLREDPAAFESASLALATLVQFVVAGPFYPKALKALLFSRMIEMDLLIVLSTSTAYIFSVVSYGYLMVGKPLTTGSFFETSTLLVTLIMLGRFVSALARHKAVESISVRSLQVSRAVIVDESNEDNQSEIDTRLLQYGDLFAVEPHSRIPTDGTVVSGSSEVNESMITGEAKPVEKKIRSIVIAGSINGPGRLVVRLSRLPPENTISNIANMVDESKLSKPKIQELADQVASYFVPVVIVLTIITLCIWIAIGMTVRKQNASDAVVQAITYAITVLIVSCPCAIGLAVPMVIVIAGGVAADQGVVIKSSHAIETANKTSHVIFDKTGTLTTGDMTVAHEILVEDKILEHESVSNQVRLSMLLGLVESNKHPVSAAVANHLRTRGIVGSAVQDVQVVTGCGVEGVASGIHIKAGNSRWLKYESDQRVKSLLDQKYTVVCSTADDKLYAVFGLKNPLRPDALETVSQLQQRNITVAIISGDDEGVVHSVATELGVSEFRAKCTPADKRDYIKGVMETPSKTIIFCGDGTNDAVALAQATIGVHINEGTDVAQSAADVVLVRPALKGILFLIDLSRASVVRIGFNFGWSFIYNLFAILLAAGAFVNARIPPEYAGLGELVSVLPVILIALQLKWARIAKA